MADSSRVQMTVAVQQTLAEFGVPPISSNAEHAFGRLAALQFASALGVRQARRTLSRERQALLRDCTSSNPVEASGSDSDV
jgi:hypothetical protein